MNFCEALQVLRQGGTVRRRTWNGMFLEMFSFDPELIYVKRDTNDIGFPWLNTQDDITSNDWYDTSVEIDTTRNEIKDKFADKLHTPIDYSKIKKSKGRVGIPGLSTSLKVYCLCYQGKENTNDTLCIYIEANSLIESLEKVNKLALPRLENLRFICGSATDLILLNESANMQSYEIYSIQSKDTEYLCSGNGVNLVDLLIGLGLASREVEGVNYVDEAGKYLLIKDGK